MTAARTDCLVTGAGAAADVDVLSTSAITAPRRPDLGLDFLGLR